MQDLCAVMWKLLLEAASFADELRDVGFGWFENAVVSGILEPAAAEDLLRNRWACTAVR